MQLKSIDHIGPLNFNLALAGAAQHVIAAMAQMAAAGERCVHLMVASRGSQGCVVVAQEQVVYAELTSAEVLVGTDQPGRLVWTGRAALVAMAVLLRRPLEMEVVATAEPVSGHEPNLTGPLSLAAAMLDMAVAIDQGALSGLPCVFKPAGRPRALESHGDARARTVSA
jgi:hypothetical protein